MSSEKDYINALERYKDIKEIADLCEDIKKLREYYYGRQYDRMQQHIQTLILNYASETVAWNSSHTVAPQTPEQSYQNAEAFLFAKNQVLVIEKGLNYELFWH